MCHNLQQYGARVAPFGRDQNRLEKHGYDETALDHVICSVDLLEYKQIADAVKVVVNKQGLLMGLLIVPVSRPHYH